MAAVGAKARMAAIASVVVFVTLALSAGLLHVPVVRQYVLQKGESYLAENQKIEIRSEQLDYNLFALRSTLRNVKIRSTEQPDAPWFFEADRVHVDLSLPALLRRRLEVERARIEGGRIAWIVDEAGVSNMPQPPPAKEPAAEPNPNAPLPVLIRSFQASGPVIRYENRQTGDSAELPNWSLNIVGEPSPQKHAIDFRIGQPGRVEHDGRSALLQELQAGLDLLAGELRVRQLRVRSGETALDISGSVVDFGAPTADLNARLSADIAPLIELTGMETPASGRMELTARIREKLDAPRVEASVAATSLAYEDFRDMSLQAEAAWAVGDERARIGSFLLDAPFGRIAGDADLALTEAAGDSAANVQLTRVDLARVSRPFDPPMTPAARATGAVQASWPGMNFAAATARGRLQLTATRGAPAAGVLPLSGGVNLTKTADRLTAAITNLQLLGMRASGTVSLLELSGLGGSLEIEIDELGETISALDILLPSPDGESVAPTKLAGPLRASIGLGGAVDAPRLAIRASSESLSAGEIENVAFRFDGAYSPESAVIESLDLSWKEQRVTVAGSIGLGESRPLDLRVEAPRIILADALALLERDEPLSGELSFVATVTGTIDEPQGRVEAQATDLIAYNEPLGALRIVGALSEGVAVVEELLLEKPDGGVLRANGSYGLEDGRYTLDAQGSGITLETLTLPSGEAVRGTLELAVSGRGTMDAPQLTASLGATELRVGGTDVGDVNLTAEAADGRARLKLAAPRFNSSLDAEAALAAPHQSTMRLVIDALDLASLEIRGRDGEPVQGVIDGVITGVGPLDALDRFSVEAELAQLRASTGGVEVRNQGPLRLAYRDRTVFADAVELISGRSSLTIGGSLPWTEADGEGSLAVAGAINLEVVPALLGMTIEEAFVLGILNINGTVGGSFEALRPRMDALLEDGVVFTPGTIKPVTNIQVRATADQQRVELVSLTADYGRGTLSANGGVPMELIAGKDSPMNALQQRQPLRFDAVIADIDLEELGVVPDGGGFVGGRLHVESPTLAPEDWSARWSRSSGAEHPGSCAAPSRAGPPGLCQRAAGDRLVSHYRAGDAHRGRRFGRAARRRRRTRPEAHDERRRRRCALPGRGPAHERADRRGPERDGQSLRALDHRALHADRRQPGAGEPTPGYRSFPGCAELQWRPHGD